ALDVPIYISDGTLSETVAISSITGASYPTTATVPPTVQQYACSVTVTPTNSHSAGVTLGSADGGLGEAINDALNRNIGVVTIDYTSSITPAVMLAALVYPQVQIEDLRNPAFQYWNPLPTTATFFTAPSALTSATVFSSATVAGSASYAGGTIHAGYECVDIMGNPGPISADYSFTDTSTKAIQFTAPPAYTGCVGWVPAIGLETGAANHEYEMPLVTQPTVLGALPVSN